MILNVIKNILNANKNAKELERLHGFFEVNERLIIRCVDENRELMESLIQNSPAFLKQYPWVEYWIQSQDEVLMNIVNEVGLHQYIKTAGKGSSSTYPRAFPIVSAV